jgi:hypothetical protein
MGEEEWLGSTPFGQLLSTAGRLSSERKLRLFACACVQSLLQPGAYPDCHNGAEVAEQMAEGVARSEAIEAARNRADFLSRTIASVDGYIAAAVRAALGPNPYLAARHAYFNLLEYEHEVKVDNPASGTAWLRDIFGNPFRPVDFSAWRTDTAVALARQMYESRDFGAMPILADALQEAGCDNAAVLNHCRDAPQTHFRGCWVVDGVLGLE